MSKTIDPPEISEKQKTILDAKVCARCGGALTAKVISENSCLTNHQERKTTEIICSGCQVMAHAVDKEVFELARELVTDHEIKYYSHLNVHDDGEDYVLKSQTDALTPLANWIIRNRNFAKLQGRFEAFSEVTNYCMRHDGEGEHQLVAEILKMETAYSPEQDWTVTSRGIIVDHFVTDDLDNLNGDELFLKRRVQDDGKEREDEE